MIKIIVVEDLENYRNVLQIILNSSPGFQCLAAYSNAEAALQNLHLDKPDVAVVDIHLPGMDGINLVHHVRTESPQTLCMICTVYDSDEDVFRALEAGAHGYILKSTPPVKILEAIHELTLGGSPMSNEIARRVVATFRKQDVPRASTDLSKREEEVLHLLSQGLLYKEIAAQLFISIDTVRRHAFNIYSKLHVKNRTEAINKYYKR